MNYIQRPNLGDVSALVSKDTPCVLIDVVDETDLGVGTYYYEIPQTMDFDNYTLNIWISANVTVQLYGTLFDLVATVETDWEDLGETVFGTGNTQLTGPVNGLFFQGSKIRCRTLLKVVVTNATNSVKIRVAEY